VGRDLAVRSYRDRDSSRIGYKPVRIETWKQRGVILVKYLGRAVVVPALGGALVVSLWVKLWARLSRLFVSGNATPGATPSAFPIKLALCASLSTSIALCGTSSTLQDGDALFVPPPELTDARAPAQPKDDLAERLANEIRKLEQRSQSLEGIVATLKGVVICEKNGDKCEWKDTLGRDRYTTGKFGDKAETRARRRDLLDAQLELAKANGEVEALKEQYAATMRLGLSDAPQ
jgi:hypothetical protein